MVFFYFKSEINIFMIEKNNILKNWLYLMSSDIFNKAIMFFVFILLARKLSVTDFGLFNVFIAIGSIFAVFANFGTNLVITREIALDNKHTSGLFFKFLPIRLFFLLVSIFFIVLYSSYESNSNLILIATIFFVISNSLWDFSESIAFGNYITKYSSLYNVIFGIILLCLIVLVPENKVSLFSLVSIYVGTLFVRALFYFVTILKKYVYSSVKEEYMGKITSIKTIKLSLPYVWIRTIGIFTDQVPILILNAQHGSKEVALYSIALKLLTPIKMVVNTAAKAIFPFLAKWHENDNTLFKKKVIIGYEVTLILSIVVTLSLVLTSSVWLPELFGQEYIHAVQIFNILAWFAIIVTLDIYISTVLSSTSNQKLISIIATVDALIMIPSYLYFSKYGALILSYVQLSLGVILLIYHIIVLNNALKLNLNKLWFSVNILPLLGLISVTTLLHDNLVRFYCASIIIIAYYFIENSPLRSSYMLILNTIKRRDDV
jgi:O-antigen/teichoic acid export membrane protein